MTIPLFRRLTVVAFLFCGLFAEAQAEGTGLVREKSEAEKVDDAMKTAGADCAAKNYSDPVCRKAVREIMAGGSNQADPNAESCKALSKEYADYRKDVAAACGKSSAVSGTTRDDSRCVNKLQDCMTEINKIGATPGDETSTNAQYASAFSSLQARDADCAASLIARDKSFLEKQREAAQKKLDDLAEKISSTENDKLESQSTASTNAFNTEQQTVQAVKKLVEEANRQMEALTDAGNQLTDDFKKEISAATDELRKLQTAIQRVENDSPVAAQLALNREIANLRSGCREKARAKADELNKETEGQKGVNQLAADGLGGLLSRNDERDPKVRYRKNKDHAFALCMQDLSESIKGAKEELALKLKTLEKDTADLKSQEALLKKKMDFLADSFKARGDSMESKAIRQKNRLLAEAQDERDTYYKRAMELQLASDAKLNKMTADIARYGQERNIAAVTLSSLPTPTGSDETYKDFTKGLSGIAGANVIYDAARDAGCCEKNNNTFVKIPGVSSNMCYSLRSTTSSTGSSVKSEIIKGATDVIRSRTGN